MAISLGNLTVSVSASTADYEKQMARVEKTQQRLAAQEKKFASAREASDKKLQKLRAEMTAAQEALNAAIANKRPAEEVDALRTKFVEAETALRSLEREAEAAQKKLTRSVNAARKEWLKANETLKEQSSLIGRLKAKTADALKITRSPLFQMGVLAAAGAYLKKTIDHLDEIAKRARDVGLTASQFQAFEEAGKYAGVSAEGVASALEKFNVSASQGFLGKAKAKQAFEELGVSIRGANGQIKSQEELLREVAQRFSEGAGSAKSAAVATQLFGSSGQEMLRIFEQGAPAIEKIFNAKAIDDAARAAEDFKDRMADASNFAQKTAMRVVNGWGQIYDAVFGAGIEEEAAKREEKRWNEEIKRKAQLERDAAEAAAKEEAERLKKVRERIAKAEAALTAEAEKQKGAKERQMLYNMQLAQSAERLAQLEKDSDEYAAEFERHTELTIKHAQALKELEKEIQSNRLKSLDKEIAKLRERAREQAKAYEDAKKRYDDLKARRDAQAQSRAEYELQLKIDILRKQGNERAAKALEDARLRNQLMERYGYSIEEANKMLKAQQELQKPKGAEAEYSDEAKKQAQRILDKGLGGKQTQEEARAIVEGRAVEGGFKSATFANVQGREVRDPIKNVKVDARAAKEELDTKATDIAGKNAEDLDAIKNTMDALKAVLDDIKNGVNGLIRKKETNQ